MKKWHYHETIESIVCQGRRDRIIVHVPTAIIYPLSGINDCTQETGGKITLSLSIQTFLTTPAIQYINAVWLVQSS